MRYIMSEQNVNEEEFEATYAFLERIHFYEMHIFKYSKRQGTRAAEMKNQVAESVKNERSSRLLALGNKMSEEFREYYLGKEKEVLFEEEAVIDGNAYYVGYTKEYVKVAKASEIALDNQITKAILMMHSSEHQLLMSE